MTRILRGPGGVSDAGQRVRLDGVEYQLRWRWLTRPARWALDISSTDGTLLVGGIRVVPMEPLLRDVRGARPAMPPGEIFVYDPRRLPQMPTLAGLGEPPSQIVYVEAAEVAA